MEPSFTLISISLTMISPIITIYRMRISFSSLQILHLFLDAHGVVCVLFSSRFFSLRRHKCCSTANARLYLDKYYTFFERKKKPEEKKWETNSAEACECMIQLKCEQNMYPRFKVAEKRERHPIYAGKLTQVTSSWQAATVYFLFLYVLFVAHKYGMDRRVDSVSRANISQFH